jgi:hypothetical protein
MRCVVHTNEGDVTAESIAELDGILDRLDREATAAARPCVVELQSAKGSLGIGLGAGYSLLTWIDSSGLPPYFASAGAHETEVGEVVRFMFGSERSEYPKWQVIDRDLARRAAREFLESGERPSCVEWAEV